MDRRGFIQSFIGAAAMAAVPGKVAPVAQVAEESGMAGFGMAPIKMEGASIPYDQLDLRPGPIMHVPSGHGVMKRADFVAQLKEGMDTLRDLAYRKAEREGVFGVEICMHSDETPATWCEDRNRPGLCVAWDRRRE